MCNVTGMKQAAFIAGMKNSFKYWKNEEAERFTAGSCGCV
jgi:hypothetical protein